MIHEMQPSEVRPPKVESYFQPAEVEDVVIETVDEEGDGDMPYGKPQFPALTPRLN